jgi:hypothetical protein
MSASTTPVASSRVVDIAKQIFAATQGMLDDDQLVNDANKALKDAADGRVTGRIGILVTIGNLSSAGQWSDKDIANAVHHATDKLANDPDRKKSLQTFASDIKAAAHPNTRDQVARIHALCNQVWTAEKEAAELDKSVPKPCAKAFKREYHMFKSALVGYKDGTLVLAGPSDVVYWANQNDPDFDTKKVMKKLESLAAEIAGIKANFPVSHFTGIEEFLSEISEDTLKAARDEQLAKQRDLTESHTLAPLPAAVAAKVATTTVVSAPVEQVIPTRYEEDEEPEVEEVETDPTEAWLADA